MQPDCLFCKIAAKEIPATIIYETSETLAFLDIRPINAGHTLVIPKYHAQNIFEISSKSWAAVMESVRVIAPAIENGMNATGINLEMNNRENAGQVVDHVHVHVIPRFPNDKLQHWPQRQYQEGEAEDAAQKIRAALS